MNDSCAVFPPYHTEWVIKLGIRSSIRLGSVGIGLPSWVGLKHSCTWGVQSSDLPQIGNFSIAPGQANFKRFWKIQPSHEILGLRAA